MAATPYTDDELSERGLRRDRLPRHVAFIMDGNGRWAEARGWPRIEGHRRGADTVEVLVEEAARIGLGQITLYAFSRENWKRPEAERAFLMELLEQYVIAQRPRIMEQNLKFATIGRLDELPQSAQDEIAETKRISESNDGMTLCLALNYGGRQEIADAARVLAGEAAAGRLDPATINADLFASRLDTVGMPDPDLVVRTAGEMRVSNFLLWQISYAELWVTEDGWPDFREPHLYAALKAFGDRDRRFGGLNALSE